MGLYFLRPEFPTAEMKSPKVYFSTDIKFVGAITKKNTRKINTEMQRTAGIQCVCGAMAQRTVGPDPPTYLLLVLN